MIVLIMLQPLLLGRAIMIGVVLLARILLVQILVTYTYKFSESRYQVEQLHEALRFRFALAGDDLPLQSFWLSLKGVVLLARQYLYQHLIAWLWWLRQRVGLLCA